MNSPPTCPCGREMGHDAGSDFFVSTRSAGRVGLVLGPFASHDEALANVERGRGLAEKADAWSVFYEFGTLRIEGGSGREGVYGR
jgi:hypothetical protein